MKLFTVPGQVFILYYGITYACIQVTNSLCFQAFLQCFIEPSSITMPFCIMIHVDGHFTRVAIRSPFYEGSRIRIALNHTILFKNEIRVLFQRAIDAGSELLQRRYIIFKGNSRVRIIRMFG